MGKYYFPFSRVLSLYTEKQYTIRAHVWDGIANRPHDTLIHYMTDGIYRTFRILPLNTTRTRTTLNWAPDRFEWYVRIYATEPMMQ